MRLIVTALLAGSLLAQEDPRFGARARLVLVPAVVTDPQGHTVDNLDAGDFVVLDNGKRREAGVDTFATGVAPIALIVAVQAAGISRPALDKIRKIGAMIQPLVSVERGCAGLIAFAEKVDWLAPCTNDVDKLSTAFERLRPGDEKRARMLDAANEAIRALREQANSRRVLLIISETRDRGSETGLDAVIEQVQQAGIAVYFAAYSAFKTAWTQRTPEIERGVPKPPSRPSEQTGTIDGSPPSGVRPQIPPASSQVDILGGIGEIGRMGKRNTAAELTAATGGITFSFARLKGLETAIVKLGDELHSQYVLSFPPDSSEAGYHRLEVRVNRPGQFKIRARPGYWSDAPGGTP